MEESNGRPFVEEKMVEGRETCIKANGTAFYTRLAWHSIKIRVA